MPNFAMNTKQTSAKQRSKIWRQPLRFKVFSPHFALPPKYYADLLKGFNLLRANPTKWSNILKLKV